MYALSGEDVVREPKSLTTSHSTPNFSLSSLLAASSVISPNSRAPPRMPQHPASGSFFLFSNKTRPPSTMIAPTPAPTQGPLPGWEGVGAQSSPGVTHFLVFGGE